jgi:hypothetical protein
MPSSLTLSCRIAHINDGLGRRQLRLRVDPVLPERLHRHRLRSVDDHWAGVLAAGAAAGDTALQGNAHIYSGGYKTNLRDIASGTNGSCGTDCTSGAGYDLVTGLGSPINYP